MTIKRAQALELVAATVIAALAAGWLAWTTGSFGLSWDALNHHVYLGFIAEHPRWDLDVGAASAQTYQYPYLYWPIYRLIYWGQSGLVVACFWTAFQAAVVLPPIWFACLAVMPQPGSALAGAAQRAAGCAVAFMSIIVLAGLQTTANDLLAAVPLLWAVTLSLRNPLSNARAAMCATLWGIATAFKLSNALSMPWLFLWWWAPQAPHLQWKRGCWLAAGSIGGFIVAYAPWGWQLWRHTGNPLYPHFGALFGSP